MLIGGRGSSATRAPGQIKPGFMNSPWLVWQMGADEETFREIAASYRESYSLDEYPLSNTAGFEELLKRCRAISLLLGF